MGGDGVAQHVQLHRTLEENAAEPIVVVVQRTLNGCEDGPVSYTHLDVYKRQAEDNKNTRGWLS